MAGAGGWRGEIMDGGNPVAKEDLLPPAGQPIVIRNGRTILTIGHPDVGAAHTPHARHTDGRWRLHDNRDGTFTLY